MGWTVSLPYRGRFGGGFHDAAIEGTLVGDLQLLQPLIEAVIDVADT